MGIQQKVQFGILLQNLLGKMATLRQAQGERRNCIDASSLPRIKRYISNQKQRHSKMTFEKEYVLLLEHYKIKYNKQTLFN